MGTTKSRKLEQDALRHCLASVFGWEGGLPNKTLCNTDVFGALVQHYAMVLDDAHAAGTLTSPDLIRLAEFLTEPSVRSLSAMVAGIPENGRTFNKLRDRRADSVKRAAINSSLSGTGESSATGDTQESAGSPSPNAKEIVEFLRKHQDRVVVIMLSRGGGFTHSRIAEEFGISRSRCYRYEKWFEGLPASYREAIVDAGFKAAKIHRGGKDAFRIAGEVVSGPLGIVGASKDRPENSGERAQPSHTNAEMPPKASSHGPSVTKSAGWLAYLGLQFTKRPGATGRAD